MKETSKRKSTLVPNFHTEVFIGSDRKYLPLAITPHHVDNKLQSSEMKGVWNHSTVSTLECLLHMVCKVDKKYKIFMNWLKHTQTTTPSVQKGNWNAS